MTAPPPRYPDGFHWGSASSSHQVEGGCTNNWTAFEDERDGAGRPRIAGGQRAGAACEQWIRYPSDLALMRDLGLNACRFSIEWSKVEPESGRFDAAALDHYAALVDALLAGGLVPMVTLHHFTDPLWFSSAGGFLSPDAPAVFARYARRVMSALGSRVRYWCTINEPAVYAVNGYVSGEFPPAHHNPQEAATVLAAMLHAHALVFREGKEAFPDAHIGIALSLFVYEPHRVWHPLDVVMAYGADRIFNRSLLDFISSGRFRLTLPGVASARVDAGLRSCADFLGVNYYTRFHLRFTLRHHYDVQRIVRNGRGPVTDMGWEIHPPGLGAVLTSAANHVSVPLIVTENGIADADDTRRSGFIRDHLLELDRAIVRGLPVKGYYYWTLLDNFEWAQGYDKRFGLYAVDFATQRRSLRPGADTLRRMITERVESKG